ncbi:MAG: sialate O-acetylesterase [Pseudoalteromonas tetraodonis]
MRERNPEMLSRVGANTGHMRMGMPSPTQAKAFPTGIVVRLGHHPFTLAVRKVVIDGILQPIYFAMRSLRIFKCFAFAAATLLNACVTNAAIELGAPFADNAVLQRDMTLPVWGWSKPGTKLTVEFGGQKKTATAGNDGKWMLELEALKAMAEPQEMVVSESTGTTLTLKNILVGEVWMASGQSNMQWIASKCDVGRVLMKQIEERVAAGEEEQPLIREAKVTNYFASLHPIEHADVEWSPADGDSSAIAYAFAYELHREVGVPIGILNCSFSQTAIQAWVPREGFAGDDNDYTRAIYQKILETDPATPEHRAAWQTFYRNIEGTIEANAERVKKGDEAKPIPTETPGNLSGNRDASWLFNARLNPMIPYAIRGAIWNQGYANMGEGLPYYHNLHSLIRGWRQSWDRPELPVYFHQFYCPGQKGEWDNRPSIGSTAEMRLGTWMARDIPNTGMASQIDITGAIHYTNKTLPGQRLAWHALKNHYGKRSIADGPMFKSYKVEGETLIVEFEHVQGGLLVAETGTDSKDGIAKPTIISGGDDQVKLFYLADEKRIWHLAEMKIDGTRVILTASGVTSPRGVSYGTGGIGFQPNLYNQALLPATPFIYYDQNLVTSDTWPEEKLNVAGEVIDPSTVGLTNEYRKMPLLSTQFRDGAVLQAGVPVTIWGSAVHDWGHEAKGKAVVKFSFAGTQKAIPIIPGMREWQVTLPAMEASAEPKTLKVRFEIDGELAHERICENMVIGDVWFVAAPPLNAKFDIGEKSPSVVRMMTRKAKRFSFPRSSRFSVCVSTTPKNRFASEWVDAGGFAAALGHRLGRKTGNPVGIVFMQSGMSGKPAVNATTLKSWIPAEDLKLSPSLMADYKDLGAVRPGNQYYDANARRYIGEWKKYWSEYVPAMIATKAVPDDVPWGSYPTLAASVTSEASQVYNVMVQSFTPGAFKGVIFLASETMVEADQGAQFGEQLSALANSWKGKFSGEDPHFLYTLPSKILAPKITQPASITGKTTAIKIDDWSEIDALLEAAVEITR